MKSQWASFALLFAAVIAAFVFYRKVYAPLPSNQFATQPTTGSPDWSFGTSLDKSYAQSFLQ